MHVFQAQLVTSSMEINIIHGIGDYSPFLLKGFSDGGVLEFCQSSNSLQDTMIEIPTNSFLYFFLQSKKKKYAPEPKTPKTRQM